MCRNETNGGLEGLIEGWCVSDRLADGGDMASRGGLDHPGTEGLRADRTGPVVKKSVDVIGRDEPLARAVVHIGILRSRSGEVAHSSMASVIWWNHPARVNEISPIGMRAFARRDEG